MLCFLEVSGFIFNLNAYYLYWYFFHNFVCTSMSTLGEKFKTAHILFQIVANWWFTLSSCLNTQDVPLIVSLWRAGVMGALLLRKPACVVKFLIYWLSHDGFLPLNINNFPSIIIFQFLQRVWIVHLIPVFLTNNPMDSNLEISETIVCKLSAVLNTCLGSFIQQFALWAVTLSCVK